MSFLSDVFSNAMGCVFSILSFICFVLAIISFVVGGLFGPSPWLGFGIFLGLAIIFFAIAGAFAKRGR